MKRLLLHCDTDPHACSFDGIVARDAGADDVLAYGGVTPRELPGLLRGAMFTRGPNDLKNTAVFIGGSSLAAGRELLTVCDETFFGPMRVSVLFDASGSQTTATAAVFKLRQHLAAGSPVVVLGYGPVGATAAELLADLGHPVTLAGRNPEKLAAARGQADREAIAGALLGSDELKTALGEAAGLIAAGGEGVTMLDDWATTTPKLQVAIDLNAVPPAGLPGIGVMDKAIACDGQDERPDKPGCVAFGALGVGGFKMKLHKAAIGKLFEANDQMIAARELYELAETL